MSKLRLPFTTETIVPTNDLQDDLMALDVVGTDNVAPISQANPMHSTITNTDTPDLSTVDPYRVGERYSSVGDGLYNLTALDPEFFGVDVLPDIMASAYQAWSVPVNVSSAGIQGQLDRDTVQPNLHIASPNDAQYPWSPEPCLPYTPAYGAVSGENEQTVQQNWPTAPLEYARPAYSVPSMRNERNRALMQHIHTKSPKQHICKKCDKEFKRISDARRHLKSIHEGQRPECPNCNKKLSREDALKKHLLKCKGSSNQKDTYFKMC